MSTVKQDLHRIKLIEIERGYAIDLATVEDAAVDAERNIRVMLHAFRVAVDPDNDTAKRGYPGYLFKCTHCGDVSDRRDPKSPPPAGWHIEYIPELDCRIYECGECYREYVLSGGLVKWQHYLNNGLMVRKNAI